MGISLGGSDGGMSQKILNRPDGNILLHQPGSEGMPKGMDIDPFQFTAFANLLYPFLVGAGVGVSSLPGRKQKIFRIWLPGTCLDLFIAHQQSEYILVDRDFPVAALCLGCFLKDQLGFSSGGIVE